MDPTATEKRCWSKMKRASKVTLYTVLNSVLTGAGIGSDCATAHDLISLGHIYWGSANALIILLPFLVKLCMIVKDSFSEKQLTKEHWAGLILHFPFVSPLIHLILALRLLLLDTTKPENSSKAEAIMKVASLGSLYESFCEAGFQSVLQLQIIWCTGEVTFFQKVSLPISLFTLTFNASKAFYVQRDKDHADPEPSLTKMVPIVFVFMMILVVSSLVTLTVICGLLKEWILVVIPLSMLVNHICLKCICTKPTVNGTGLEQIGGIQMEEMRNKKEAIELEEEHLKN